MGRRSHTRTLGLWMNGATDGHAKNFSLFLRPGGRYQLATLYDVLPIHPVLGDGPAPISAHRARMAMAVRSKNPHWRIRDILRRHWTALGSRHDIVTEQGQPVDALIAGPAGGGTPTGRRQLTKLCRSGGHGVVGRVDAMARERWHAAWLP